MAKDRFLDRMCLALWASGLWVRYAMLQNLIPSFLMEEGDREIEGGDRDTEGGQREMVLLKPVVLGYCWCRRAHHVYLIIREGYY